MYESATVFIVDDEASARKSVAALVESMGVNTKCFASAEEFLEKYDEGPGCLVSDLRMVGMSGTDLQDKLKSLYVDLPVIIITAHADVPSAVRSMRQGAVTFLEKTCTEQELWQAICDALRKDVAQRQTLARQKAAREKLDLLTEKERAVLGMISSGHLNKQVAKTLDVSVRTVEIRRQRIMKKVGVNSFAELMRFFLKAEDIETGKIRVSGDRKLL